MENTDNENKHGMLSWQNEHRRGKIAAGILVFLFGFLFLLKELNFPIPRMFFTWPMFLIALGTVVLIKHKFRKVSGYVLILIGKLFLLKNFYPDLLNFRIIWPVLIMIFGISFIIRPKKFKDSKKFHKKRCFKDVVLDDVQKDDFIDTTSFFGGIKKNVVSKNFIGADIVTFFGGSEINLSQADIQDVAIIDTTNIFGGLTLIIPRNWKIQSELTTVFGSIEDKRGPSSLSDLEEKTLVLQGTCLFGGIEIITV